jgi:recombinational DNA repair protein (RecF pathway)
MTPQPLKCMNCHREILPGTVKIFAGVCVCDTCHGTAKNFYDKLLIELQQLLTIAKESIRVALIEGKFQLSEQQVRDISKKELLERIVEMEQDRATKR